VFIAVNPRAGLAFGPFSNKEKAIHYVHRYELATGGIDYETEKEAQDGAGPAGVRAFELMDSLEPMGWEFIGEVTHVDEDDEELTEESLKSLPDSPWQIVQDDGFVIGPFPTHEMAAKAALEELTKREEDFVYPKHALRAAGLLAIWDEALKGDLAPLLKQWALDVIHGVDWIIVTPTVYLAAGIDD
jgi:hypothetical protein